MDEEQGRERLGEYVTTRRRARFGSVEKAIRAAEVNRATWLRVEGGERVRDESLSAIEAALGWQAGDAWRVMAGQEPLAEQLPSAAVRKHSTLRQQILDDPELPSSIRRAMLALLDSTEPPDESGSAGHRTA